MADTSIRPTAPYVSTDLRVLDGVPVDDQARDILVGAKVFRRLDPDYYAWLRHKMDLAKSAFSRGRLPEPTFDALRDRFNALHDQALVAFGESSLHEAVWRLDPKSYAWPQITLVALSPDTEIPEASTTMPSPVPPPRCSSVPPSIPSPDADPDDYADHQFPEDPGDYRFLQPVIRSALDKVHAIRERALALGWTEARLYQNRGRFAFPCGNDYGLVCSVHSDDTLGIVTQGAIEIVCRDGHSLHVYRNGGMP